MRRWLKGGTPWIWLTGGAVALSMVMVIGLILLIAVRGLGHFWPAAVVETHYTVEGQEPARILGSIESSETVTAAAMREAGYEVPEDQAIVERHLFKRGNRDVTGTDFSWYIEDLLTPFEYPRDVLVLNRTEWGDFFGYLRRVMEDGEIVAEGEAAWDEMFARVERATELRREINQIERYEIGRVNLLIERARLDERGLRMRGEDTPEALAEIQQRRERLDAEYDALATERSELRAAIQRDSLIAEVASGDEVEIRLANIVRASRPNAMTFGQQVAHYVDRFQEFILGYPREANTEGGIFPAIFGTVTMVMLMSIIVTPIGVLAAIYLREYAKQGPLVRVVRISVNNLAGVPSIVFGVFGLGFFIYFLGGSIDQIFYSERLPAPTFGSPGLFWASLTLALLTLPVVIVSTEEGLTRIPRSVREGSLALGATKAETLWRVVVPMAAPAMMTGLILAIARAAGEVAPLMLVGVVALAPNLPVDGIPPYIHLERAFMHLGFHIYDVGFQSPNVEAARPLVYATSLVLVLLIVVLNLTAMAIRNHLREKFRGESD